MNPSPEKSAETLKESRDGSKKKRRPRKKDEEKKDKEELESSQETKGTGVFVFPTGATYDGEWERFGEVLKRHGKGTLTEGNYVFDGEWKEDQIHGYGTFRYASGSVYQGEWVNNKYEGKGRYTFADGSFYEGQWQVNKMHGTGCFTDKNGVQFRGQFYNNSGPGLTTWYN